MNHLGLFEGIGGFSLAARWMGWKTVAWVEIDPFCQKVLSKNFPDAKGYGDIRDFDGNAYKGEIDILTGGFPCQPFSVAGKQLGADDDRYLWDEMLRVIANVRPTVVVGENVANIKNLALENVFTDLAALGYIIECFNIPACSVGAPHERQRAWIIAYDQSCKYDRWANGFSRREWQPKKIDSHVWRKRGQGDGVWNVEPGICRVHYGIPAGMDRDKYRTKRVAAMGNAIVPQIAYNIFHSLHCV